MSSRGHGTLTVQVELNGIRVPLTLDAQALAQIVAALASEQASGELAGAGPLLSICEAAVYLRCKRQRIDDLLYQRRLTRIKDGRRTLISRAELEQHLNSSTARARA
jgi:excisionase family DNA binding protein